MTAMRAWTTRTAALIVCGAAAVACGTSAHGAPMSSPARGPVRAAPAGDWPTFDFNAQRTGVGPARTGITRGDLRRLGLRVVHIDGTVDAAAVELHGLRVRGRQRDVVYVTTTYGRTIALDAG